MNQYDNPEFFDAYAWIEAVEEPMPLIELRGQMPEEMRRPMMLLVKASKV